MAAALPFPAAGPILLLLLRHQEVAVRAAADAAVAALPQDVPFYRFNLMLLVGQSQAALCWVWVRGALLDWQACPLLWGPWALQSARSALPTRRKPQDSANGPAHPLLFPHPLVLQARTVLSPSPSWQPAGAAGEGVAAAALAAARARAAPHLARLEARALRILDLLHGAGYRVHVFKGEGTAAAVEGEGGWMAGGWGAQGAWTAALGQQSATLFLPLAHAQTTAACAPTASGAWGAWWGCSRASWSCWMWRGATGGGLPASWLLQCCRSEVFLLWQGSRWPGKAVPICSCFGFGDCWDDASPLPSLCLRAGCCGSPTAAPSGALPRTPPSRRPLGQLQRWG